MSVPRIRWWICTLSILTLIPEQTIRVCEAAFCTPPCLLVSNTSDIVTIDYKTGAVSPVISGLTRAVAIDVHFSLGYIFWSDVTEQNIKRLQIGGSATTIITGIGVCDGLAVDWRSSKLYWTDTTYDSISKSDLSGNNKLTLINFGLEEPRAIALDLDSSLMFWTDWGTSEKIEKASLDGNQRVAIVTTFLYYPNGIELDRGNKIIYWVDAGYDRVETVDYNGNNRKQLFELSGLHPFDVTLIAPFLFFTDWNTLKEVHELDATTGHVIRSYSINGGRPMGIVAYDYARQPPASSPCALNNGGCSHFCVAKPSGYECVCPTGLTVKQDGKTCEDRVKRFIMFADADGMSTNYISLDDDYFISRTLFKHLGNQRPIALDYDPIEDRVYWSDVEHGRIFSAFFNATSLKTVFYCNVQTPDGLAIDYVGRNIYWTDTGTNRIEVGRLDGKGRKLLFKDGLDEPRAMVLDERNGIMYWTDWGTNPKIEQAGMDGSARRAIVTGNLGWPNGLTIDQATNRLFWADAKLDKVEVSDLDGGNRQHINSYPSIHPYGLAVYMSVLYWTDWHHKSIVRYNLSTGNTDFVVSGLQKPMDIHVFDPSLIFSGSHNCSQNNGLCSDFCLLKPRGYQCACPTGISLKSDGKTCDYAPFHQTSSDKFMIYAEAYVGRIDKVPLTVPGAPCFPLGITTNITRPVAVDYDPVEGKIYWTDVTLKQVARAFPNGSSVEVIAHNNVDTPDGLAVDYVERNIYWTDKGTSKIEVARLDGSSRRTLIASSVDHPRAIILDIAERKMYWSDWGSFPKIEKANMDASARTTLISSELTRVNSLALDYQNRLLYWCDASLDRIERVDLQGNNRVLILDLSMSNLHPFGLALSDNTLYWSDWNDNSVHKYNMTTSIDEVMIRGLGQPMELHIHDHSTVYSGTTSCSQFNGGCSHLCLPNPSGHQCFCPEGVQKKPGDAYTCQGVNRCPVLSAPAHGSLQPCTNLPGETCQFSCDAGFILIGSTTRTCDSYGSWSGTQPQCNVATCPALPTPSNGNRQGCTGTTTEKYNTVCVFSCNPGFNAFGSPSRKCLLNGTWSGQDFLCQGIACGPLNTPPKAILINPSCGNTYGTNCVFGCQSGYGSPVGNVTRTCLQTGQWSGNDITCTAVNCPPLSAPPRAILLTPSCGATYGSNCTFGCRRGYGSTDGNVTRTCLHSGQWSGNPINCTDIFRPTFDDTCPSSPLVVYADRGLFTAMVNWTEPVATDSLGATPSVMSNYKPPQRFSQGTHVITYTATDQSGNGATCTFAVKVIVINCTSLTVKPGDPLRMSSCANHYGVQCNFSCPIGHRLNGSPTVTCLAHENRPPGFWDNPLPKCQAIACPSLPVPTNGVKTGCSDNVSEPYDTHCSFSCKVGFNLIGSSARRCLENETWSGEAPICQDIQAPTITCPPDMRDITTEPGQPYADVSWQVPVPTDNSNEPLDLSGSRPPQKLNVGANHITYTVTDSSGLKDSCSFIIHVIDLEPPKFASCPEDIQMTSTKKWTNIYLPGVTVTDNVGVHSVTLNRVNGSKFTWGEHNITYTAMDNSRNIAICHFLLIIVGKTCDDLPSPLNGAKACDKWLDGSTFCTLHCSGGYDFASKPPNFYLCGGNGKWFPHGNVPDCSKVRKAKTVLDSVLHYLTDQCTETMHEQIAGYFVALYTQYLGTNGNCEQMEDCSVENVEVECGEHSERRRRRDVSDAKKSSKVPITVKFSVKVPLPSNTSQADLNQTTQQLSSDILAVLNKTNLNLNISGIVLEYDISKPPVFRFVGLVCDRGQVLRGTKCVNCPVGYFFNTTSCQACAADHYQNQEAQTSCISCPSGTSTFGQKASKWNKDCQEIPNPSNTEEQGIPKKILYPAVVVGSLVVIALIVITVFFLRRRCLANRRSKSNDGARSYTREENMGHANPTYDDTANFQNTEPQYMEIGELQQLDFGFNNPHFDRGSHYQTLDNAHGRTDSVYMELDNTHSEV